jgi:hypothetical protein
MMIKQIGFKNICVGFILICMLGVGISLIAQEESESKYTLLVFGKLYLTPTGDAEVAEKLLKEKLLSAAKGIEGLKITALKRMQLAGGPANTNQPDFVMMAELTDVEAFTKLMTTTPAALKEYGEGMKVQAGAPQFELYQIVGTSTE